MSAYRARQLPVFPEEPPRSPGVRRMACGGSAPSELATGEGSRETSATRGQTEALEPILSFSEWIGSVGKTS